MAGNPEQQERSFTVQTSEEFVKRWRELDSEIDLADVNLDVAKERRHSDDIFKLSRRLSSLQYEQQDLISRELILVLEAEGAPIRDLSTVTISMAGRVMQVTLVEVPAWQRGEDDS